MAWRAHPPAVFSPSPEKALSCHPHVMSCLFAGRYSCGEKGRRRREGEVGKEGGRKEEGRRKEEQEEDQT